VDEADDCIGRNDDDDAHSNPSDIPLQKKIAEISFADLDFTPSRSYGCARDPPARQTLFRYPSFSPPRAFIVILTFVDTLNRHSTY